MQYAYHNAVFASVISRAYVVSICWRKPKDVIKTTGRQEVELST